jgi:ubiquinol-cytochrome c reductase cytochrome c1 subunit
MLITGFFLLFPFKYFKTKAYYRNLLCLRWEMYSVRDGLYYKHFKTGSANARAYQFRGVMWA